MSTRKPMISSFKVEGVGSAVIKAWSDHEPEIVEVRFARPEPKIKVKIARDRNTTKQRRAALKAATP